MVNHRGSDRVTGHQHHSNLWAAFQKPECEIRSRHSPHPHIAKQQIDRTRKLGFKPHGLSCVLRRNHREVRIFENLPDQLQKGRVVFNKQNGFLGFSKRFSHRTSHEVYLNISIPNPISGSIKQGLAKRGPRTVCNTKHGSLRADPFIVLDRTGQSLQSSAVFQHHIERTCVWRNTSRTVISRRSPRRMIRTGTLPAPIP